MELPNFPLKKIIVLASGVAAILAGIAMLVLPGPGVATILLGLAILGTEFPWAKRLLDTLTDALLRLFKNLQQTYRQKKEHWKKR